MATVTTDSKKEAAGPVISGGHLVARALKNEGVEVIWTLCGGHIIDIYDGDISPTSIRIIYLLMRHIHHRMVQNHLDAWIWFCQFLT